MTPVRNAGSTPAERNSRLAYSDACWRSAPRSTFAALSRSVEPGSQNPARKERGSAPISHVCSSSHHAKLRQAGAQAGCGHAAARRAGVCVGSAGGGVVRQADSARSRRVQLPARRRHLRPRPTRESASPALAVFREHAHRASARLRLDVPAGPGRGDCRGTGAHRRTGCRRLAERGGDVRRGLLGAARLAAAAMGAPGGSAGGAQVRRARPRHVGQPRRILEPDVLRRCGGGARRRAPDRSTGTDRVGACIGKTQGWLSLGFALARDAPGAGRIDPRRQSAVRGIPAQPACRGCAIHLAREAARGGDSPRHRLRRRSGDGRARAGRWISWVFQRAGHRQSHEDAVGTPSRAVLRVSHFRLPEARRGMGRVSGKRCRQTRCVAEKVESSRAGEIPRRVGNGPVAQAPFR